MSAAHTKGLLAVRDKWIIPADHVGRKIGGHVDRDIDFVTYAHIIATVQSKYHDEAANARRLVACWNACEGLTQDHFDGGWTAKGLSRHARAMEDKVTTALTLLSDALETFDEYMPADHEVADRIRAFLKGGA